MKRIIYPAALAAMLLSATALHAQVDICGHQFGPTSNVIVVNCNGGLSAESISALGSLETVIIGSNALENTPNALSGCKSIKTLDLSEFSDLQSIGLGANIETLVIRKDEYYPIEQLSVNPSASIYVLKKYVEKYKKDILEYNKSHADSPVSFQIQSTDDYSRKLLESWGGFKGGIVNVPEGVTALPPYVFAGNDKIKKVNLPKSLQVIGEHAFANCSWLDEVALPDGLQYISDFAFENCISLKTIAIPAGAAIGEGAFWGCKALKNGLEANKMTLSGRELTYCAIDLISFHKGSVPDNAFRNFTSLKSVVIQEGNKSIGKDAFFNCKSLRNITLPSTLEKIEPGAFSHCDAIKNITSKSQTFASLLFRIENVEGPDGTSKPEWRPAIEPMEGKTIKINVPMKMLRVYQDARTKVANQCGIDAAVIDKYFEIAPLK